MKTPDQAAGQEMISFRTNDQEFCIDISAVREIRGWTAATPIPHSASYVRGVINLRGSIMPVIDLGARLGFGQTTVSDRHVIIVTMVGARQVGLLVDAVCETLNVGPDQVQAAPAVATSTSEDFVEGFFPLGDRMIGLLAIERVASLTDEGLDLFAA